MQDNKIKKILKWIISLLPIRNSILLESVPDLSDNTLSLYEYFLKIGLNKTYRIVWKVNSMQNYDLPKNVICISSENAWNIVRFYYYRFFSKVIISCNKSIGSIHKNQVSFYLNHGTPCKRTRDYFNISKNVNYCLVPSDYLKELYSYEFNVDVDKIFTTGFARNDELFHPLDLHNIISTNFEKVVVWYPTFRQHKTQKKIVNTKIKNALPLLTNDEDIYRLDNYLMNSSTILVIKPHFAQDMQYIKSIRTNNILFIDDEFFKKNNIKSYQFVGNCDALLTDYSSIYYDYTLCDKPIGLVWDDFEEYSSNPGLIHNYEYYFQGGEKIYSIDELILFIKRVHDNIDLLNKERNFIKRIVNVSCTPDCSKRTSDFIIDKSSIKL